ncbi:MAG TPA: hypothetical protein PK854_09135 [Oscillospiraceae bacterium]|nr:hypothetical protein [Oscillospiraceae bacterium]HPS35417.1 hypothetical protein [Oscillospiraceae bacterium]
MKKFIAVLASLVLLSTILPMSLSAAGVPIDAANFPDPVFRNYTMRFDLDKDGALSEKELSAVKELSIVPVYCEAVSSLEGIQNFSQVERIWCYCNNLTELNLSGMTKLSLLICSDNNLKILNLSGCTSLNTLNCEYNRLTELDLSGCTALMTLECSHNQLERLDLSKAKNLETLSLFLNRIASLDLSSNQRLRYFSLSPQSVTLQKILKNGKWTADLSALAGKENLGKIIWYAEGALDTSTGIITFNSEPGMFLCTIQTGALSPYIEKMAVIDVKVNLYKGSAPVITANNLSFTQRSTPFDLKSEPGLNLLAYDPVDGELTSHIRTQVKVFSSSRTESGANAVYDIIPTVSTNKPGRYTITYTVNDSSGNTTSLDVYVYIRQDPALLTSQNGASSFGNGSFISGSSPTSSDRLVLSAESAASGIATPPMGAQDPVVTAILILFSAFAAAILLFVRDRPKVR